MLLPTDIQAREEEKRMGKSSSKKKKRRSAARKREKERNLASLRGFSLLDSEHTENAAKSAAEHDSFVEEQRNNEGKTSLGYLEKRQQQEQSKDKTPLLSPSGTSLSRHHVEFVFPRAQGKSKKYIFDKQFRNDRQDEKLQAESPNENGDLRNGIRNKRKTNETIDEILNPAKKRKKHGHDNTDSIQRKDKGKKRKSSADLTTTTTTSTSQEIDSTKIFQMKLNLQTQRKSGYDKIITKSSNAKEGQISGRSVEEAASDKCGLRPRANSTDAELMLPQGGLCDESIVLRAHRWNDEVNHVHQITPKGFVNLGNTCFLNATLQCLAYLPPFCQSLIKLSEANARSENGKNQKHNQGQKITSTLCSLFQRVHGFDGKSFRDGAIAPKGIVNALPTLGSCGSRNGYKFRPGRQEDAHEFLVHLLDAMHDGELRAAGINQHASGWRDRLPVSRLDETTFIHRIFGGYFRSQVRCGKCGYRSNTYDPFMDLSLEVSKKASNSVLDALSAFTRKETLDSANQWKCSGCKKYVCATKQLTVFRPPLSLCIQLKRFSFSGGFGNRMFPVYGGKKFGMGNFGGSKITKPIEFPADLNLPLSDGRSCAYSLTGIVIHVGGSASSGHYTAYVKKPGRKGADQWYNADDSFVEPVSAKTVLRQKDAYVLFYCRKEVKLEFPSPPPRGMSTEAAKEFGRARAKARADSISAREEATRKLKKEDPGKTAREDAAKKPKKEAPGKSATEEATTNSKKDDRGTPPGPEKQTEKAKEIGCARAKAHADSSTREEATKKLKKDEPRTPSGPVKRISTKIHPLASPALGAPRDSPVNEDRQDSSVKKETGRDRKPNPGDTSRNSFPIVSSSELREHLMKRLSEPPRVLLQQGNLKSRGVEDDETTSSSSDNTSDGAKETKKPASARTKEESSEESDHSSSSDSESSSQPSKETDSQPSKTIRPTKHARVEKSKPASKTTNEDEDASSSGESSASSSSSDESSSDESTSKEDATHQPDSSTKNNEKKELRQSIPNVAFEGKTQKHAKDARCTKVVLAGSERSKVRVMLGPRRKRSWQSKTFTASNAKGSEFDLLGNRNVSRWDEDEEHDTAAVGTSKWTNAARARKEIVAKFDKQERSRKRKMHLDRWDSVIDQGKRKKTKPSSSESEYQNQNPKQNIFQKIQSGMQKMNKGKAKGFNNKGKGKGSFRRKGKGSY